MWRARRGQGDVDLVVGARARADDRLAGDREVPRPARPRPRRVAVRPPSARTAIGSQPVVARSVWPIADRCSTRGVGLRQHGSASRTAPGSLAVASDLVDEGLDASRTAPRPGGGRRTAPGRARRRGRRRSRAGGPRAGWRGPPRRTSAGGRARWRPGAPRRRAARTSRRRCRRRAAGCRRAPPRWRWGSPSSRPRWSPCATTPRTSCGRPSMRVGARRGRRRERLADGGGRHLVAVAGRRAVDADEVEARRPRSRASAPIVREQGDVAPRAGGRSGSPRRRSTTWRRGSRPAPRARSPRPAPSTGPRRR